MDLSKSLNWVMETDSDLPRCRLYFCDLPLIVAINWRDSWVFKDYSWGEGNTLFSGDLDEGKLFVEMLIKTKMI